jgi:cyclin-dependent kinase-like
MKYRLEKAGGLFLLAVSAHSDAIIGYTCSTASTQEQLQEESMSLHEPGGSTVCIHSVCVAQEERRKGVATRMLKSYIQWVQQTCPEVTNMQLICKEHMVTQ